MGSWERLGMERRESVSSIGKMSVASGRPRVLSVSSTLTTRTRRSSRVEVVEMPGGSAVLVEVGGEELDRVSRKDSLGGVTTVGGVSLSTDTRTVDKKIKQEIAHHSPAVGEDSEKGLKDDEEEDSDPKKDQTEEEPLLAFGATNLFQHLYLALGSPAIFRLPALAYKWSSSNGSAFLIAYFTMMMVVALPLCVLEHIMAQFSSLGPTTLFRCLPLLTGVGVGMVTMCLVLGIYTSTVLLWSLRYTVDSFQSTLPWSACPNTTSTLCGLPLYTPAQFYFFNSVLGAVGDDDDDEGGGAALVLTLVFPLMLVWLLQSLYSYRSRPWQVGVVGRVWALLTVLVLFVFLIYGLKEEYSGVGLGYIFGVKEDTLAHPDIWLDAFGQVIWSLGPTLGLLINRASYKHFRDRIRVDAYTAVVTNVIVTLLLCLAIFPFLTYFTKPLNSSTPGFFFEMTSLASTRLDIPQLGAVLLYLTTSKALFDHAHMLTSTVAVGVSDLLPGRWRSGGRLFLCHASVCLVSFLAGLPFVTTEGIFLVRAIDAYMPWVGGLLLGSLEVVGLAYLYGATNIQQHFKHMLRKNTYVFALCWKFVLPPVFVGVGVWACVVGVEGPETWDNLQLTEAQEEAYRVAGVVVSLLPGGLFVLTTLVVFCRNYKSPGKLLVPRRKWGPALVQHRALYTPGVLRAKVKAPYLIVQVEAECLEEDGGNVRGPWLPYGFYWYPSKATTTTTTFLQTDTRPPDTTTTTNTTPTSAQVARYLQMQFGYGRVDGGMLDDIFLPNTTLLNEGDSVVEDNNNNINNGSNTGRNNKDVVTEVGQITTEVGQIASTTSTNSTTRLRSPSSTHSNELVLQPNRLSVTNTQQEIVNGVAPML
ncbi:hypothetical protein Pcinc_011723 [Petrolisthes cinctipes]|uniref:Uncharacterized protein n=1 Tax=Petrolisthes cinctipes TaxID=88211 RepID=A0AAE1G282_PETCI|nr:hypothetical protein Pcinc_011723 [Petrolisthes cinctipes]